MSYKPDILKGVRIIELGMYASVPAGARVLADWGAEVIKVESLTGDPMRYFGEGCSCPITDDENPIYQFLNGNKKDVAINLKTPEGQEIMYKLLSTADAFITNTRVKALKKMGLDWETLHAKFPKLVWAHMSGYGLEGPDAELPGFDIVSYWARSGCSVDIAAKGGDPLTNTAGLGDNVCGVVLAAGLLAGILKARETGEGTKVSASLYGTAIYAAGLMVTSCQDKYGDIYPKDHFTPQHALNHVYKCKDGEWVAVCLPNYKGYYKDFCEALGFERFIDDPRYNTADECNKPENRIPFIKLIDAVFASKTSEEMIKILHDHDLACGLLNHFSDVSKDEQAFANHYVDDFVFRNGEKCVLPGTPLVFNENERIEQDFAPGIGEHNELYLKELGYTDEQISSLKEKKVI